ncbi:MAG: hypothetical protein ACRD3N_06320 [Terracidiphilus sp.]
MGTYPPPGPGTGGAGRRIEEIIELIEMELRGAIGYVNDAIVPPVRRESIAAMRTVAETLRTLADRFEQRQQRPAQTPEQAQGQSSPQSSAQPSGQPEGRKP